MISPVARKVRLLDGFLGGDGDLTRLYLDNPEFHASIDAMVQLVPDLVDLAAKRGRDEDQFRARLKDLDRGCIRYGEPPTT